MRKIDQRTQRVIPKRADGTTFTYTEALAVPVEKAGGRQESWSEQPSSSVSESGDLISAIRARHAEDDDQARNGAPPWVRWSTALSQKAVEIPFHFLELLVGLVQALVYVVDRRLHAAGEDGFYRQDDGGGSRAERDHAVWL